MAGLRCREVTDYCRSSSSGMSLGELVRLCGALREGIRRTAQRTSHVSAVMKTNRRIQETGMDTTLLPGWYCPCLPPCRLDARREWRRGLRLACAWPPASDTPRRPPQATPVRTGLRSNLGGRILSRLVDLPTCLIILPQPHISSFGERHWSLGDSPQYRSSGRAPGTGQHWCRHVLLGEGASAALISPCPVLRACPAGSGR
jgi:hypothetical protein